MPKVGHPRRRELKARVQDMGRMVFEAKDDGRRAGLVRSLCPCEYIWTMPLWDIIFAACKDPSPQVRIQALHVIEDAYTSGMPDVRGIKLIFEARQDPDTEVRSFAKDVIRVLPKLRAIRSADRKRRLNRAREQNGLE